MLAKTDYAANGGDIYCSPGTIALWPSNCGNADCGPAVSSIPTDYTTPSLQQKNSLVLNFSPRTAPSGTGTQSGPTGIVCAVMMTSPADITDGLANTYLVGEKYLEPILYRTGSDPADNEAHYVGDNQDVTRYISDRARAGPAHTSSIPWVRQPARQRFQRLLCDGSVRPTSYSINPKVHQYLGNKSDGLAVVPGTSIPIQP